MAAAAKTPKTLAEALMLTDEARVITSASKPYKIMHTNAAWSRLTGFKFTEAAGQTCALLQGPKTEESVLSLLEASITAKQPVTLRLTNYTASGKPFRNTLHVHPLYNSSDEVVNYAATVKSTTITDGSVAEVECKAHRETLSTGCKWAALGQLTVCDADGAAAKHTRAAREEAAQALLGNHAAVALDLTNPSTSTNIDGKPLTQPELERLSPESVGHVDQFLRELCRRLLGHRSGESAALEEMIEPSVPAQAKAWIGAAEYLSGRIQSTPSQMAGRAPDMGPAAAAAMRGVMTELAESAEAWAQLYGALEQSACSRRPKPAQSDDLTVCYTEGIATRHDSSAREEAARKIITNHAAVLLDLTNPSPKVNINQQLLTQQHLVRVSPTERRIVDLFLRETAMRLLGGAPSATATGCTDSEASRKAATWVAAAKFLDRRIHSKPGQKPGRKPDMSHPAALAMKAVMHEVAGEQKAPAAAAAASAHPPRLKRTRHFENIHSAFGNEEDAIIFTEATPPYRITHCNKAWCDMCGYSLEEIEGATNAILQGPDTDFGLVADLMACVRRGEKAEGTLYNYKKGGERFVNQVQIEPVLDDNLEITQFMAILNEIDMMPSLECF